VMLASSIGSTIRRRGVIFTLALRLYARILISLRHPLDPPKPPP
jgi:hypothetical protein